MGQCCCKYRRKSPQQARGAAGDRDRMPVNHEAFLLMANTQNDMEDWVKAIRRVIWAPFGGGIFGQRLEDTVQYERKFGKRLAPLLVEQCVDFIREHGLNEEGLFRMPGQANLVKELQDSFDCGEKPLFDSDTDVHTVASLLKLYLRELPEPVIPFAKYEDFLSCAQLLAKDEEEGIQELTKQVISLPHANYNLLDYICSKLLCRFLDEVQSYSSVNKMSVQNLATVFGPNILRPKIEDPVTIMEGTSLVQSLMTVLISEHHRLFRISHSEILAAHVEVKAQARRALVEWVSEGEFEGPKTDKSDNYTESVSNSGTSLDVNVSTPVAGSKSTSQERADKQLHTTHSPRRIQTLPTWKYSFKHTGGRAGSAKLGGSTLDIPNLAASGNWLMNGLSSLRGHRRTSSGERAKELGSSQRLSTYDNVPSSSLSLSVGDRQSAASTAWSTSSCEISVADSAGSSALGRESDSSALDCAKADWPVRVTQPLNEARGGAEDSRIERFEVSVSSGGCSDNSDLATLSHSSAVCSKALQGLVTELKSELSKQRAEYENRIKRLEESSTVLRLQVSRLEEELDQGKKKYTMLEIKVRNADRARDDAEQRNQLLQKEMEAFFATLGNLTQGFGETKPK
ncbi:rho GTPase-activating protein 22-like isoform X1 [Callorhinchus milii]|uniref:rho GTPase-activating protein 22-like isoform X1 n=1 Tax=Callorhinchus milii TaxID=7868 RepID=UPI00045747A5|nr:rho GTPase-activating protein 22-like isoform X1 [Callorhinchus milii]|eukprot:gi/632972668/ref/XP_007902772.1/ PREDICTED: rho GTPase-activating protein 22-like isoform X1 [Callorhinchus milii]